MTGSYNIGLEWLGQSGFLLHSPQIEIACDLYLSDFCRKKSKLDHTRLMPVPIQPEDLDLIDHYLITHAHIDHFDPETVGAVLRANPETKFWCPPSCQKVINEYFPDQSNRFTIVNSGRIYKLTANVSLIAVPAAHEELEKTPDGEYIYFSYVILFATEKKAVFFAGDTIPYPGQAEMIRKYIPGNFELTMILPVNGRDKKRADLGFKGNMNIDEAVTLANDCSASSLVPCHFDMFALNNAPQSMDLQLFRKFKGETHIPEIFNKVLI